MCAVCSPEVWGNWQKLPEIGNDRKLTHMQDKRHLLPAWRYSSAYGLGWLKWTMTIRTDVWNMQTPSRALRYTWGRELVKISNASSWTVVQVYTMMIWRRNKEELPCKLVKSKYIGFVSNPSQLEFTQSLSEKSLPGVEILAIRNQPAESICGSIW